MRQRWFSRRALLLHLAATVVVAGCLGAFAWQFHRARQGNALSWAYCFEWPIFAVLGVIAWWQLVHDDGRRPPRPQPVPARPMSPRLEAWQRAAEAEDEELAAYNRYLAELAQTGARKTWKRS